MVTGFLFPFTQVTPIWHVLAPSFELINGQDSVPRRFPSKKAYSHWSPRPPNNTSRKRVTRGSCEGAVERSNRKKAIFANLPAQDILHISIQNQGCSFQNKPSTSSISQSLKCFENRGFQLPTSPPSSQASNTCSSLLIANRNQLGKTSFNVWSSHHKSFQNFAFLPFPTIKRDLHRISSHPFLITFLTPTL